MIRCDNCGLGYLDAYKDEVCPRCKSKVKEIDIIDNLENKLKELWNFCDKEQKYIFEHGAEKELFQQGYIIALRKVQYEINHKCSELSKFDTDNNIE
jgi:hypothetical protein